MCGSAAGGPADSWRACRQLAGLQTAGGPADSWRACRQLAGLQTAGGPADSWWACGQLVGLWKERSAACFTALTKYVLAQFCFKGGVFLTPTILYCCFSFQETRYRPRVIFHVCCKPWAHGVYCGWKCHASRSDHGLTVIDHSMN